MEKLYIVANFKSNMTNNEAKNWLDVFISHKQELKNMGDKEVILAPTFTFLLSFNSVFSGTNIKLSAQNLSPFDEGAFTGEVNGKQIKDFADYVIIGHSERRNNFGETDEMLTKKVNLALKYGLTPIFCVQGKDTNIPQGVNVVAYEPVFAIGTGTPDTPENADKVCEDIIANHDNLSVLYGGSVTSDNVANFTKSDKIKGVLVGGASLDPMEFLNIIKNA